MIDAPMQSNGSRRTRRAVTALALAAPGEALDEDAFNGRIWLGIHFRKAMTDGSLLGHEVAAWSSTATSNLSTTATAAESTGR